MAVYVIPIDDSSQPFFTQDTDIEGTSYRLTFAYNQRENAFYLSIGDASEETNVVDGIKIVCNRGLIRRYDGVGEPWPPGEIHAVPTDGDDTLPGLGDLGQRVILTYTTSDDPNITGA